jgi:hypothetical protein
MTLFGPEAYRLGLCRLNGPLSMVVARVIGGRRRLISQPFLLVCFLPWGTDEPEAMRAP